MRLISDSLLTRGLLLFVVLILVVLPFHATITVWLASLLGHYTALRLWKEFLLFLAAGATIILLIKNTALRQKIVQHSLIRPILIFMGLYIALHILIGGIVLLRDDVTLRALGYGLVSNLRFFFFFMICIIVGAHYSKWFIVRWKPLLLWPAGIVVMFGLFQAFILPVDVLRHAGFGPDTIAPYIAVDQKIEYARIQSTLRGPNPLGAYLVFIGVALVGLLFVKRMKSWKLSLGIVATLTVLYGTYSRSAYIGLLLGLAVVAWLCTRSTHFRKLFLVVSGLLLVIGAGLTFALRNNDHVQNVLFHTDEHSLAANSSNASRASVMLDGLRDIGEQPFGRGPGTAGPASVYNDGNVRVAENYFLQIGQEVGVLGGILFIAICGLVGRALWRVRELGVLPLILLASLIGISGVNLLSHAWADDTLAYLWWGFAGLTIGAALFVEEKSKRNAKKTV